MADIVVEFLQSIIKNPYVLVILVAMFPLIELKGAIPIGLKLGLKLYESAILSFVGSTIIVVIIFFLLLYVFKLLKKIPLVKRLILKLEIIFENKANEIAQKSHGKAQNIKRKFLMTALFIFVAIPLPLTGVWTGTAIAVFLGMSFKDSILPLAVGNFVAGCFITLLTWLCAEYVDLIITCMLILAIIMLVVLIIKIALAKPKNVQNEGENKVNLNDQTDENK